jgi:acyl carrier protein
MGTKLTDIFRDIFDDQNFQVSDDLTRGDCPSWDSLAHVKLMLAVEEEFGVKLSFDQVANIRSVADLKRIIGNS